MLSFITIVRYGLHSRRPKARYQHVTEYHQICRFDQLHRRMPRKSKRQIATKGISGNSNDEAGGSLSPEQKSPSKTEEDSGGSGRTALKRSKNSGSQLKQNEEEVNMLIEYINASIIHSFFSSNCFAIHRSNRKQRHLPFQLKISKILSKAGRKPESNLRNGWNS